jgi:hypothetical protein
LYDARLLDVQDQQSRFVRTSDLFRNAERLTCWGEPSVAQAIALIMIPFVLQGGLDGIFCAVIDCLIRTSCTIAVAGRERSPALPVSGNVVGLCDRYRPRAAAGSLPVPSGWGTLAAGVRQAIGPAVGVRWCRRPRCRQVTTGPATGAVRPSWGTTATGIVGRTPPGGSDP